MHRENLVKVTRIGRVMGRKGPPTLREPSAIKIVFSKHFVLIMRITIRVTINMDDIRQEKLSERPILNLSKRIK